MKHFLRLTQSQLKKTALFISEAIVRKVKESGLEGAVIGLSGGIDSSLTATLAARSLKDKLVGVILPEKKINLPQDVQDAVALSKKLGIPYQVISIDEVVAKFKHLFGTGSSSHLVAWGNVKPRIRMIILYFIANSTQRLVLGTGNKTEYLLGYFTKHGDGATDILPIGDLYKTQVWQLAEYLSLPSSIITKTPTAGLWKGQTDEDELGMSYQEIDRILFLLTEEKASVREIVKRVKVSQAKVLQIKERIAKNHHKRVPPQIIKLNF
jgi:NAD+ synthase